jgi:cytochrome c biogenesis protein CcdA
MVVYLLGFAVVILVAFTFASSISKSTGRRK